MFKLYCDRCSKDMGVVTEDMLRNIAENEYKRVCEECHKRVTELEKFFANERQKYWNKLNNAFELANKNLAKKVKELKKETD